MSDFDDFNDFDDFDDFDDEPAFTSSNNNSNQRPMMQTGMPNSNSQGMQSNQDGIGMQNMNYNDPNQQAQQQGLNDLPQPPTKSFVKISISLGILVFVIVIALLLGKMWIDKQKDSTNVQPQNPVVQNIPVNTTTNNRTNTPPRRGENTTSQQTTQQDQPEGYGDLKGASDATVSKGSLVKVSNIKFGDVYTNKAYIVNKGYVEIAGTATYSGYLEMQIKNNGKTATVTYYCNKDTLDAVNVGSSVTVNYQLDSQGKIIIVKIMN